MSLEFNAVGDYATRTGTANLGNAYSGSMCAWYRAGDTTASREIVSIARGGGYVHARIASSTSMEFFADSAARATFTIAQNTWYLVCLITSDPTMVMRVFDESGSELTPATGSNTYSASYFAQISRVRCGNDDAYGDSASGQYRYLRYWNGVSLSAAEFAAEAAMTPSAGTPAARTSGLYMSWPLPDGTDTTDWGSAGTRTPTINSGGTSAQEPSIGGGSSGGLSALIATVTRRIGT